MGIIQVFALCVCYLLASIFLESSQDESRSLGFLDWLKASGSFKWLAFVHHYIFWLLLIPILMCVVCGRLTRTHRDIAILGQNGFWLAVIVTVVVVVFGAFIISIATGPQPYTRHH